MNVANLKEGIEIKNYPELCKVLEMPKKAGNSKKSQLKELERFVNFQQIGHSFLIKEIYATAKEKVDNRGKTSVYGDMIQLLVMDYLIESNSDTTVITRNQLLKHIHMINENYSYCSANVPSFSTYADIDEQIVYDFFNTTNNNFKSALEIALKNLRDKALIIYDTVTSVAFEQGHRVATEDERKLIVKIEKKILNELDFERLSQVRASSKWKLFQSKVSDFLKENSDILYYYTSYEITVNREHIEKDYKKLLQLALDEAEREKQKNELNAMVCKRIEANAIARKELTNSKMKRVRAQKNYIADNKKLIEILIDNDFDESIVAKVEEIKRNKGITEKFLQQLANEFGESERFN